MDIVKRKSKILYKAIWKWHQSLLGANAASNCKQPPIPKAKGNCQLAPVGCFTVWVLGSMGRYNDKQKHKFFIKTEFANHPLFRLLLEDAELEYGYTREGPILLPCDLSLFCDVLEEIQSCCNGEAHEMSKFSICRFAKPCGSFFVRCFNWIDH